MQDSAPSIEIKCGDPDAAWVSSVGRYKTNLGDVLAGLCRHLVETGVPLTRVMLSMRTLHPLVAARGIFWRQGNAGCTEQFDRGHDVLQGDTYLKSPLRLAYERGETVRRHLTGPQAQIDFPVLEELRDEGLTDYVVMPVRFAERVGSVMTWATDRPEGFSEACIRRLAGVIPVLGLLIEVHWTRDLARTVLDTYVGQAAGRRVLSGQIKRGDQEKIAAVLWYCDLRGFTRLTELLPGPLLIDMLNRYFGLMAGPVHAHGGEVLKFIGDAMLAIFPLGNRDAEISCNAALASAREAMEAMEEYNRYSAEGGERGLGFGIAVHMGDVIFGNIGAPDRLDFTVIGPAVNRVVRIEEMCRRLDCQFLVSAEVASLSREPLISIGRHDLRGLPVPVELFTSQECLSQRQAAE